MATTDLSLTGRHRHHWPARRGQRTSVAYHGHLLYTFAGGRADQGIEDFFMATPGPTPIAGTSTPASTTPAPPTSSGNGY